MLHPSYIHHLQGLFTVFIDVDSCGHETCHWAGLRTGSGPELALASLASLASLAFGEPTVDVPDVYP